MLKKNAKNVNGNETQYWAVDRKAFLESQPDQFYNRETYEILPGGIVYESKRPNPCGPALVDLSATNRFSVQIIALTDAANVYTASISQQPRTVDKRTKITLSFIRDLSATVHFSFLDFLIPTTMWLTPKQNLRECANPVQSASTKSL